MAVKIRLRRMGSTKKPFYRIVVTDSKSPRDGRFIENIGHYNQIGGKPTLDVNEDKALSWLKKGAIPTHTVKSLFGNLGLWKKWQESKI
ncbi:MAG: 30S ribosomal protein S16 [bacterium]|nr:30S ribosomal protein S16 [bacterium]